MYGHASMYNNKIQTDLFQCVSLRKCGPADMSAHPFPALPSLVNCIKEANSGQKGVKCNM